MLLYVSKKGVKIVANIDFYMNPEIMGMCNDLGIEYARFCGIMAIMESIEKRHPDVLIRNATSATLLGIEGKMPCDYDMLLGAFDTLRYSKKRR
jgi:hypothetical protein